jgi:7-carboxy-7-deazaguanine synthase
VTAPTRSTKPEDVGGRVVAAVEHYGCPLVEMTGGEPLLQKDLYPLMERLHASGHQVLIETGGHRSIEHVPAWATVIMDVKCPGSGEAAKHDAANFARLRPHDEVKFVVADRTDYEYARAVLRREGLASRVAAVHLSPVHGGLDAKTLSEWVLGSAAGARAAPGAQVHLGRRRARRVTALRAVTGWRDRARPVWRGRAPRRRGRPGPRTARAA